MGNTPDQYPQRKDPEFNSLSKKETLPSVELILPIIFAGKQFQTSGGTSDHRGNSELLGFYNKQIIHSGWSKKHVYYNPPQPIVIEPSKLTKPGYQIFAFRPWKNNFAVFNLEWRTEDDYNQEKGSPQKIDISARKFPATEMRIVSHEKVVGLLARGYGVFTALSSTRNLIWTEEGMIDRGGRNIQYSKMIDPGTESIKLTGHEVSLWDNKEWLEDDSLVASIANAYRYILEGKSVYMNKPHNFDALKQIQIAQALSQMIAIKHNRVISWATEYDILGSTERQVFNLIFSNGKPDYLQGNPYIDPIESKVSTTNSNAVANIKSCFSKPIPEALLAWAII